jgi:hypothetical protein
MHRAANQHIEPKEPLIDGEAGFHAQIIHARPAYVETPADGSLGSLAEYKDLPGDASWREEVDEFGNKKQVLRRTANKNIIVRTVFLSIALVGEDGRVDYDQLHVVRVTGRGIAVLKERFSKPLSRRSMRIRDDEGNLHPPPVFGAIVKITSELVGNARGDWYVPTFEIIGKHGDPGGPTKDEITAAKEMFHEREAHAALSYAPTPAAGIQSTPDPVAGAVTPTPKLGSPDAMTARFTSGRRLDEPPEPPPPPKGEDDYDVGRPWKGVDGGPHPFAPLG